MNDIAELIPILNRPQKIAITSHRNPDGDAVGSSLALMHWLNAKGHEATVVFPSEYPDFLSWMTGVESVVVHDIDAQAANKVIADAEHIFCLDFNSLARIDRLGEVVDKRSCPKTMIDHHLEPADFDNYRLHDTTASSTCELIFKLIVEVFNDSDGLTNTIGECILTGILTDTGSFKYATSPRLFRIVASLIESGVDDYKLQDLIFNSQNEKHLRLLGHCLKNRMEILEEYKTGIIYLSKKDYEDFDIQRGDTEGIVNFMLKIKSVVMAVFISEQPNIVKLSLRSKGDFSVAELAKNHFKGGGHKNAAGGYSFKGLRGTIGLFKEALPAYKEKLQNTTLV